MAASTKTVGVRLDEVMLQRLVFLATSKGLDPSTFARRLVHAGCARELQEMASEVEAMPTPGVGRPRMKPATPDLHPGNNPPPDGV